MTYIQRKIDSSKLTKEVFFDFDHEKTRVENDRLFIKIKESEIPIDENSKITFVKHISIGSDTSTSDLRQTFDVISIEDDVIEILNPQSRNLSYDNITEYSMYDVLMNEDEPEFNYLPKEFTEDWSYFVVSLNEDYNVSETDFKIRIKKPSKYATNPRKYFYRYEDLLDDGNGVPETIYIVKYNHEFRNGEIIVNENESIIKGPMTMYEYEIADKTTWETEATRDGNGRKSIYVKIYDEYNPLRNVWYHYSDNTLYDINTPQNIIKYWKVDEEHVNGGYFTPIIPERSLTKEEYNRLIKDIDVETNETHQYIEHDTNVIPNKLQIVLHNDRYKELDYDLLGCKLDIVHKINGERYDDRVYFKECGEKVQLCSSVSAYTSKDYMSYNVQLTRGTGVNLFQETLLKNEYINDVINSAIPEINDYEKSIIKPYIQRNGENGKFDRANTITFNLHFRDRVFDGVISNTWSTDDSKTWNEHNTPAFDLGKSDLLYYLGFTEEDVYYQKMCLQKSFLRLSFYDDYDPLKQQLLFYSTVFIDTNEIYGTYNSLKTKLIDGEVAGYDELSDIMKVDVSGTPRLSSKFVITDKFNIDKSSEGFYIYLFNKTLPKNIPSTIYMKVEFNHAKYGKTIPFLYFVDEVNNPITTPQQIKEKYAKIDDNGGKTVDMKAYFKDLHIELKVKYDEDSRSHIYYLPYDNKEGNNEIIFNLFEPKING